MKCLDILDGAKRFDWHLTLLAQCRDPESFNSVKDAMKCYHQMYQADQTLHKLLKVSKKNNSSSNKKKHKRGTGDNGESQGGDRNAHGNKKGKSNGIKKNNKKYCNNFKRLGHTVSECWFKNGNKRQRDDTQSSNKNQGNNFTEERISKLYVYNYSKNR